MNAVHVRLNTSIVGGVLFFGLYWLLPSLFVCLLVSLAGWILVVEWPRVQGIQFPWYGAALGPVPSWEAIVYPALPLVLLIAHVIEWRSHNPWYGIYPFIAAWIVDSVAFFVGTAWGSNHCFPVISPRKTWEGVAGGVGALCVTHMAIWLASATLYPWWIMLISALLVAAAAIIGDVSMSWFKRRQGLKDTGAFLPGHGGLLDRMDSVLGVILLLKLIELFI